MNNPVSVILRLKNLQSYVQLPKVKEFIQFSANTVKEKYGEKNLTLKVDVQLTTVNLVYSLNGQVVETVLLPEDLV